MVTEALPKHDLITKILRASEKKRNLSFRNCSIHAQKILWTFISSLCSQSFCRQSGAFKKAIQTFDTGKNKWGPEDSRGDIKSVSLQFKLVYPH